MICNYDIRRQPDSILIGIALENAVLDFVTTDELLQECLSFVDTPHRGSADLSIGSFGPFGVTLNKGDDDQLSIFIDGPSFEPTRELCAAIWSSKDELRKVVKAALSGSNADKRLMDDGG